MVNLLTYKNAVGDNVFDQEAQSSGNFGKLVHKTA
jgi:hypothetical protein